MKPCAIFLVSSLVGLASGQSFAQERNSWGETFSCSVNWFAACAIPSLEPAVDSEKPKEKPARPISNLPFSQQRSNLPEPVRNVLESPSPETARAYVTWSRQANEKLAKASEYIAQATREINASPASQNGIDKSYTNAASSLGPVGLYYFFSPTDRTVPSDVAVLNKIFQEGKLGVVGIAVGGRDDEMAAFVGLTKPLFPVRRGDTEIQLIKPAETPELYLALPMQKKIVRLGARIDEKAIYKAIGSVVTASIK